MKNPESLRVFVKGWLPLALLLVNPLAAQQVAPQLFYHYYTDATYPFDRELGELYHPATASTQAQALHTLSVNFWQGLLQKNVLIADISPLSSELLQLQFAPLLGEEPTDEKDFFVLQAIRSEQPLLDRSAGQLRSKLIFANKNYLLATLYFRSSSAFPAEVFAEGEQPQVKRWLVEAVDFDFDGSQLLRSGYDFEPREEQFLRGVGP